MGRNRIWPLEVLQGLPCGKTVLGRRRVDWSSILEMHIDECKVVRWSWIGQVDVDTVAPVCELLWHPCQQCEVVCAGMCVCEDAGYCTYDGFECLSLSVLAHLVQLIKAGQF